MRVSAFLYDMWNKGLDLIFPGSAICPLCGSNTGCGCREELLAVFASRRSCERCGRFLDLGTECKDCRSRGEGFPEQVIALAPYSGGVRRAIHSLKYKGDKRAGRCLAELLWEGPGRVIPKPDLLLPVPLHKDKQQQRGFNQAELLANYLGSRLSVPVSKHALSRVLSTQPQADLSREERRINMANAFSCLDPGSINGKTVLLVDDIVTTGYTLEGCGLPLRAAGAVKIYGICLASGSQSR